MANITEANKEFYDKAAPIYEQADGRRKRFPGYLKKVLKEEPRGILLDVGAGTGFISKAAVPYHYCVIAMDISREMLKQIDDKFGVVKLCADITEDWTVPKDFCDKIMCVSVLHHVLVYEKVFSEAWEHLEAGGIFYSDLDLDCCFYKRFKWLIKLYRFIRQPARRYQRLCPEITEGLYHETETLSQGIDAESAAFYARLRGFSVKVIYHWGNGIPFPRGFAPYVSIKARKRK